MSQIFPNFVSATEHGTQAAPIQSARVAFTGTGSSQSVQLDWDVAFLDTSYTVVYSIEVTSGNAITSQGTMVKSASGILVDDIVANSGYSYVLHAVAFHD